MNGVFRALGPHGLGIYEVEDGVFSPSSRSSGRLLVPGFVDIHIHGAFGIDFMSATASDMVVLADNLERQGYEAFLPTTVTASAQDVSAALHNLPNHRAIRGFHLEGPFISREYPGAQPVEAIADAADLDLWQAILGDPRLRVATLAPEQPNALGLITTLMQRNVRVGIGHTNATYEEARRGFEFGATHTTHTFNAMRPFHHREAGAVGYALANDGLYCELIYDRLHVSMEAARLLLKCKPDDKVVAVSDSTQATGLPPNTELDMWGHPAVTGRGDVRLKSSGALAGSAITLLDAFKNLAGDFGEEVAIRACCLNPRRLLGWPEQPTCWIELDSEYRVVARFEV